MLMFGENARWSHPPSPLAYSLYAYINVDNCERPLRLYSLHVGTIYSFQQTVLIISRVKRVIGTSWYSRAYDTSHGEDYLRTYFHRGRKISTAVEILSPRWKYLHRGGNIKSKSKSKTSLLATRKSCIYSNYSQ